MSKNYDSRVDRKRGGKPRHVPSPMNENQANHMEQQTGREDPGAVSRSGGRPRTRGQQRPR